MSLGLEAMDFCEAGWVRVVLDLDLRMYRTRKVVAHVMSSVENFDLDSSLK